MKIRILNALLAGALIIYCMDAFVSLYEYSLVHRSFTLSYLNGLIAAEKNTSGMEPPATGESFDKSCHSYFFKYNCDFIVNAPGKMTTLSIDSDTLSGARTVSFDESQLEWFPLAKIKSLIAKDLHLEDESQIEVVRVTDWDLQKIVLAGKVKSGEKHGFKATFVISNFKWRIAVVNYF